MTETKQQEPISVSGQDRFAIWDVLGREKEQHESEIAALEPRLSDLKRRIAYLDNLRAKLVPSPCRSCKGYGWNWHHDEWDCRTQEVCARCNGTREAPAYDWEK